MTHMVFLQAPSPLGDLTPLDAMKGALILGGFVATHVLGKRDRATQAGETRKEIAAQLDSITQTLTGMDGRSGPDSLMGKMDVVQRKTSAIEVDVAKLSERVDGHEKRLDRTEDDRRIAPRRAEDRTE